MDDDSSSTPLLSKPQPQERLQKPLKCPVQDANEILSNLSAITSIPNSNTSNTSNSANSLSTFEGVFLPQFLSTWGILSFMRLGYVVGQAGLLLSLLTFVLGYVIAICVSVCQAALAANDRNVLGGGAYFLVSRSLGPRMGGAMGIIYFVGGILGGGMGLLGLAEFLVNNYGVSSGFYAKTLPESALWIYLYGSAALAASLAICWLGGTKLFARISTIIFYIIVLGTLAMNISFVARQPFSNWNDLNERNASSYSTTNILYFTGFNGTTLRSNLWPQWHHSHDSARDFGFLDFAAILGIIYPACTGMLAGSSMSGDLQNPGRQIPKGSLLSVLITFLAYLLTLLCIASSVERKTLVFNPNFVSEICLIPLLIQVSMQVSLTIFASQYKIAHFAHRFAMSVYSILGTLVGSAKQLQAMARDKVLPGMERLAQGTSKGDEPTWALLFVWFLMQICMFFKSLDSITPLLTIFTLMSYGFVSYTCWRLASTFIPNYRPTFKISRKWQRFFSLLGLVLQTCVIVMVDVWVALGVAALYLLLVQRIMFRLNGLDETVWGDLQAARDGATLSAIVQTIARSQAKQIDMPDSVISKYWYPSTLLLSHDHSRNQHVAEFLRLVFGPDSLILQGSFQQDSKTPLIKLLDGENKIDQICSFIRFHGMAQVSCNLTVLCEDLLYLNGLEAIAKTAERERKSLLIPLNLDLFDHSRSFIDVWMIGSSGSSSEAKKAAKSFKKAAMGGIKVDVEKTTVFIDDEGPAFSFSSSNNNDGPIFSFPQIKDEEVGSSRDGTDQQTVRDYGLLLQMAEMIRKGMKKSRFVNEEIRIRLFLPLQPFDDGENRDAWMARIKGVFSQLHLHPPHQIIEIPLHLVRAARGATEPDTDWALDNLVQKWSRKDTLLILAPIPPRQKTPVLWRALSVPTILMKSGHASLS